MSAGIWGPLPADQVPLPPRTCVTCGAEVVYDPEKWSSGGWVHADGTSSHWVDPAPQCPKCGSPNYVITQPAWGVASDCTECGHHDFMSIGD